jgi:hypothetical protein
MPEAVVDERPAAPPQVPPMGRPPMYLRPRRRFPWATAGIAVVVVALSVGALYAFSGAKVEIVPTVNTGSVTGTFTATPSSGDLPFALVSVQKVASESVPAESTVSANDTAQGTITIYNTQSKAQALIKNTRFQTSAGLIFRIHESVTVPPASGSAPGTLEVTVYGDSAGENYNIAPTTFSLPGLAGSAQEGKVYAKSTAAMTGGFTGKRPSVSQATDDAEHAKLKDSLTSGIAADIAPKVPEGYVLIQGATVITYTPLPDAADDKGGVLVKEQGTATAVVFPSDALARAIAGQVIGQEYTGQTVTLQSVSGLTLAPAESGTPAANAPFTFMLSGNASLVWKVDPTRIAGAVAGKSRTSAQSVLTGFPEVSKAYLTLRPFWRGSYPADPTDITVTVDTP